MDIIYVYSGCSPEKYKEYIESKGLRNQQQAQKYNQLLMEGMVANGAKVSAISSRPINRAVDRKLFYKGERDQYGQIDYTYVPFVNYPVLRNISVFFGVFFSLLFKKVEKPGAMVCDALNIVASLAALMACKLRGIRTVGVVTDVPCHRPNNQSVPMHERINLWIMKRFDSYLLLTEQMNEVVNPRKRPYVVMEGHADISMAQRENTVESKHSPKVCLYAGSLRRIYGIGNLVEGFVKANIPDTQLHIYGSGDYEAELKTISQQYENVKYMGIAPNETVVAEELKATLLVNPRPTNEDYTQYSFPSKNMEYMASGTPVLTTCLPGMPKDYNPYVFLLREETADGVCAMLREIFEKTPEQLHAFGMESKAFVMENKNNVSQAKKLLNMLGQ